MGKGLFSSLKGIDAFGKVILLCDAFPLTWVFIAIPMQTMEDVKVKTRTGAFCEFSSVAVVYFIWLQGYLLVTLICAAVILAFTSIEFFDYRKVSLDTSIVVDKSRGEKLTVNLNVTFPRVPCYRELAFLVQSLFPSYPASTFLGSITTKYPFCCVCMYCIRHF
jgi:hypothetical protein